MNRKNGTYKIWEKKETKFQYILHTRIILDSKLSKPSVQA